MEPVKMFQAFGIGCLTALMLGFGPDVTSVLKAPGVVAASESGIPESRLHALEERATEFEQTAASGQISNKVVAPFEVVDGKRKRIFYVSPDGDVRLSFGKKVEVEMLGYGSGASLAASSASGNLEAGIGGSGEDSIWGVSVREQAKDRIVLGSDKLVFFSAGRKKIAGIGVSPETREAEALVNDKSGNLRARMGISTDGKGLVEVLGANKIPIAQLTESESGGGKVWIGNAAGVGMVEAGDAGGYGIVRAGPEGFKFIPTPGLALPETVIVGKR